MPDIEQIIVENFQSHRHTLIEPAPAGQLTVIVGPSDSGKTAILRALRWLFYNVPRGADFIRVGATVARARIDYASGKSVIRERSRKGLNRYEIGSQEKAEPDRYEGFDTAVPLEVQQLTGVRPVQIGDMTLNLNLADQLSGPFLGSEISAPARAKVLGKLAGTEEIDFAARGVGTDLYRRRQDEKRLSDEVARLQEVIKQYDYLEELGIRIEHADSLLTGIKANSERLEKLKRLREQLAQILAALCEIYQKIIDLDNVIHFTEPILINTEHNLDSYNRLRDLFDKWGKNAIDLSFEERTLLRTQTIGEAEILFSCVVKCLGQHSILDRSRTALASINLRLQAIDRLLDGTRNINTAYQSIQVLQDKIATLKGLRNASERFLHHIQNIVVLERRLERLAGIDEAAGIMDTAKDRIARRNALHVAAGAYRNSRTALSEAIVSAQQLTDTERRLVDDYRDTLLAAGVCPVCGSKITENTLKEAV